MIRFDIQHEFRTASFDQFWHCYLDPEHQARLDQVLGMASRELLERREDGGVLFRRFRMVPKRALPGWLRKVTGAGLEYEEHSRFDRASNRIDVEIHPELFANRMRIAGVYTVERVAPDVLVRRWTGEIEARVPLVGGRVERSIVADMEKSYEVAAPLTQECLDACAGAV